MRYAENTKAEWESAEEVILPHLVSVVKDESVCLGVPSIFRVPMESFLSIALVICLEEAHVDFTYTHVT